MTHTGLSPARNLTTDWRFVAVAATTAGVVAAGAVDAPRVPLDWPLLGGLAVALLVAWRARAIAGQGEHPSDELSRLVAPAVSWLAVLALVTLACGFAIGQDRLRSIDRGALHGQSGSRLSTTALVVSVPRRGAQGVSFRAESDDGRFLVSSIAELPELPLGREVAVEGSLSEPQDWRVADLRRHGAAMVLDASSVRLTGRRRHGVAGVLDGVRDRAEAALERGMSGPAAALARGFVLGQDDRIDSRTVEDFKRSGLAHLLAVSGQNVLLLALLAMPILGATGMGLRGRLVFVLLLIAVYVPVAGAGPSIQRAGVMGAAGIVAALAGRPQSRIYALLLAALVTLVINPRASGDVGWQLSFAAVIGILLWTGPLRDAILVRLSTDAAASPWRRALAEGIALTVAATLATAPLMAFHFEAVPIATLGANILALPAVAPVMWLGMISAAAGQLPLLPVEPINVVNGALIGFIAQVARWFGEPSWALLDTPKLTPATVGLLYAVMVGSGLLARKLTGRRRSLRSRISMRRVWAAAAIVVVLAGATQLEGRASPASVGTRLEITVLDVGQGDAVLLRPPRGDPILVDTGPPGSGVDDRLQEEGIDRLAAVVITHDQLDHAGGAADVLARFEVDAVVHAAAIPSVVGAARASGTRTVQVGAGERIQSGRLVVEALSPDRSALERAQLRPVGAGAGGVGAGAGAASVGAGAGEAEAATATLAEGIDPNRLSVVLVARWRHFSMLLTGDAEAESVFLDPGPIDVLKVAHHGSEDAGLKALLERTRPEAAVVSVGADNPHGHPTDGTLSSLDDAAVRTFRTDHDGDTTVIVGPRRFEIRTAAGS